MYENQLHFHESTLSIPHFQTQSSYSFPSVLLPNVSGTRPPWEFTVTVCLTKASRCSCFTGCFN